MALSVKHKFNHTLADAPSGQFVKPSDWNDTHELLCASGVILGRKTADAGAVEELTPSQALDLLGSGNVGDILYRSSDGWTRLAPDAGKVLQSRGANNPPAWVTPGWQLIQTVTLAAPGSLTFTDAAISNFSELLLVWSAVNTVSAGALAVFVSGDGGTTNPYLSYQKWEGGGGGTENVQPYVQMYGSSPRTEPRLGHFHIVNTPGSFKPFSLHHSLAGSASYSVSARGTCRLDSPVNWIWLQASVNITAGSSARLYGRL